MIKIHIPLSYRKENFLSHSRYNIFRRKRNITCTDYITLLL